MKMVDQIAKNTPVDNKYHLVSFDIPETMKTQRDHFRRTIKKLGFVQIQQSLWVSNKDLGEMVELASYEYGVEKYIAYFVSISSNIEYFIEKKFNNK
jgi:DNA-binding transcriptional regulator PaaX